MWSEWEQNFFNLELALDHREKVAATPKGKAKPRRKVRAPLSVRTVRAGAYQHLRALDKIMMQGTGSGLSQFSVTAADKIINPLRAVQGLPQTLVLHLDEGSTAFAICWYMAYSLKLRFAPIRDIFHREWNDIRLALGDTNLWWCILLTTMVFNIPYGPWEGGHWWGKMVGAMAAYVARAGYTSPLFSALYELICKDQNITPSGTTQHRQMIFDSLMTGEAFTQKGPRVALKRWFSWIDSFKFADKCWHSRLLGLIMWGMCAGVYKDFTEVPLWRIEGDVRAPIPEDSDSEDNNERDQQQQASAAVSAAEQQQLQADEKKEAVKKGSDLQALRKSCKNSLHVAACIMCKDGIQTLCRIIFTLVSPVRAEHGMNAQNARSPDGVRAFYVAAARGRTIAVLEEISQRLVNPRHLDYMGFTMDYSSGMPAGMGVEHDMVREQNLMAEKAMNLFLSISRHRAGSMLWHYASWIGLFALAASDDENEVELCFEYLRRHYRGYLDALRCSSGSKFLKQIVAASPFSTTIVRQIAEFYIGPWFIPNIEIRQKLVAYARELFTSLGQTKIIEDTFQKHAHQGGERYSQQITCTSNLLGTCKTDGND